MATARSDFTASPAPLSDFSLATSGGTARKLFDRILDFRTYTVAEVDPLPPDFSFTTLGCTVSSPNGGVRTVSGRTATINLAEGENVTCTYTNTRQPSALTVTKTPSQTSVCNGSTVTYTYVVTNTGAVALTVNLVDDVLGDIDGGSGCQPRSRGEPDVHQRLARSRVRFGTP